jgi:putative pyruvate formate lyase activating enzyme
MEFGWRYNRRMTRPSSAADRFLLPSGEFEPAYLALSRSDALRQRAAEAAERLRHCMVCPRDCGVDRAAGKTAACHTGRYAPVRSYFSHLGEENCLRGWRGSGTVFFSMCNLRCVFCQNYDISQGKRAPETTAERLAGMMLEL